MRVVSTKAEPGSRITVSIEMDVQGDEVATSFGLNFDPAKLSNPTVTLGTGVQADAVLTINTGRVESGQIGILVDSAYAFARSTTSNQIVTVTFDVAKDAPAGPTPITFGYSADSPVQSGTSDATARPLKANYTDGAVNISKREPANPSLSGHVSKPNGRGLRNAMVVITK